jgi:hypothetical protein
VDDGIEKIADALDYEGEPGAFVKPPRLYISDACENLLFCMETWTGLDGDKGASKDPIDCLRWFFEAECGYEAGRLAPARGGYYGAGGRFHGARPAGLPRPKRRTEGQRAVWRGR